MEWTVGVSAGAVEGHHAWPHMGERTARGGGRLASSPGWAAEALRCDRPSLSGAER